MTRYSIPLVLFMLVVGARPSAADVRQPDAQELKRLSIEQLMNIDVTLAARRPEPIGSTPAAISVVTGEDIRRSGVTTIPDAVALADGVQVARFNNGTWSITARGFNAVAANKMLVMIDGRTVYSPLFSGVFWNAIDYTLEDIDRIEVIRGPGATLWGANAVNGVVNIVTRHTRDTKGGFVQLGTGNEDPGLVDARYGGAAGRATYRVYGKYAGRDSQKFADGSSAEDHRSREQAGFRLDSGSPGGATFMLKADAFHSTNTFPDRPHGEFSIADLQARWTQTLSPRSELQVQSYFNHEFRLIPLQLTHRLDTVDIDLQHAFTTARHALVWGGGFRVNHDKTIGTPVFSFDPPSRTYPVSSVFAQDDVTIVPDRAYLTAGLKLEHNAFSGGEWQPNIRGRVMLPRRQMLWTSVARAVRRPTRFETDVVVGTPTGLVVALGNEDFRSETLVATEVGYRMQANTFLSAEVAAYAHTYDRLRSQEAPAVGPPIPIIVGNTLNGTSRGIETTLNIQPIQRWRMHASYTFQKVAITRDADSRDISGGTSEANDPNHVFGFRTSIDFPHEVQFDARLRSIGALPNPRVPGYTELGLRIGWFATSRLELSIAGEDLLHDRHAEFNPTARGFEEFERSVHAHLAVRF